MKLYKKIKKELNEKIRKTNSILNEVKFKNLFYIGKTKNVKSGYDRIEKHIKGYARSTFTKNWLSFIYPEFKNLNKEDKEKFFKDFRNKFINSVQQKTWQSFFEEYFEIYILPLNNSSTIDCTESILIYLFQPPINIDGCDKL